MGKPFVWLLATVLLTAVSSAEAQQPVKIPCIGHLRDTFGFFLPKPCLSDRVRMEPNAWSGQEGNHDYPHRDNKRWGPRGCRFGCQSGATGPESSFFEVFNIRQQLGASRRSLKGKGLNLCANAMVELVPPGVSTIASIRFLLAGFARSA